MSRRKNNKRAADDDSDLQEEETLMTDQQKEEEQMFRHTFNFYTQGKGSNQLERYELPMLLDGKSSSLTTAAPLPPRETKPRNGVLAVSSLPFLMVTSSPPRDEGTSRRSDQDHAPLILPRAQHRARIFGCVQPQWRTSSP